MDRALKAEILRTVKEAMMEAAEQREEVWLNGDELTRQFSLFSAGWLKQFGWLLPREHIVVTDANGNTKTTRWAYPRNKIQRMLNEGKLRDLKTEESN